MFHKNLIEIDFADADFCSDITDFDVLRNILVDILNGMVEIACRS